jgi:hypothetical protein
MMWRYPVSSPLLRQDPALPLFFVNTRDRVTVSYIHIPISVNVSVYHLQILFRDVFINLVLEPQVNGFG